MRRRLVSPERLESRKLLTTALINEVLVDRLFGDANKDQYIELRGDPGSQLSNGTYLVAVDSRKIFGNLEGRIKNIFDLSNLSFGSNGFLVLQQQESPFTANPNATVLKSTSPGFGGLPGNRYSDANALSNRVELAQATFMLIQTSTRPNLEDDIDINSDGFMDTTGVPATWNILDSITVMNSLSDGHAYGNIAFVSTNSVHFPQVTAKPETTIVRPNGWGYVGRLGTSVGSSAKDWVGGVVKDLNGDEFFIRLAGDVHGLPAPLYMHGRELDHVGSENFVASAHIQLFNDSNENGVMDNGEAPLSGIEIHADRDSNNQRSLIETIIEPDDFVSDRQLNNLTPGVTLSTAVDTNVTIGFNIQSEVNSVKSTGSRVFSHEGIPFFNSNRRFRADFYRPAQSVSIDFIGDSDSTPTIGRLEAFDAAGNSLQMLRTGPLRRNQVQRLAISLPTDNIAYMVAYPENTFSDSSPFGRLDRFAFSVPEASVATNSTGSAFFHYLEPGTYVARPDSSSIGDYLLTAPNFTVSGAENFSTAVPAVLNVAPVIADATLSIPESAKAGDSAGNISASDRLDQEITFSLVDSSPQFSINSATGSVQLKSGATLNFETNSTYVIRVRATDNAPKPLSSEREFTVTVLDVNEPPTLSDRQFTIRENPTLGDSIGIVTGLDVDEGENGVLGYRIVTPLAANPVAIDAITGELTVLNPNYFDFESRDRFNVTVEAFDGGNPSLTKRATITVRMSNVNEPHAITTEQLSIGELAVGGSLVGQVVVSDPDANESYQFGWAEGFSSDEFEINSANGRITLKAGVTLSYVDQPTYTVAVTVLDKAVPPLSSTREIVINVLDENNEPVIENASLSIAENSPAGTEFGVIQAADVDAGQTISFSLLAGQSVFTIETATGALRVKPGATINFESQTTHEIVVLATDSGAPSKSSQRTFTVAVLDVNEPPTISTANFSATEALAPGSQIGKVLFGDPDTGDRPTIELASPSSLFSIDSTTGVLRLLPSSSLDFETAREHVLALRLSDGVTAPVLSQLTITVQDRNDAPRAKGEITPLSVVAGNVVSFIVPADAAVDQDAGQVLTYNMTGLPAWLTYNPATRTLSGTPWNPQAGTHQLTIVARDNGSPALSVSLPLEINVSINSHPWNNPERPLDVSNGGGVTPTDALLIINQLNTTGSILVPSDTTTRPAFMDVNKDNRVSPSDALVVINFLNTRSEGGSGEAFEYDETAVNRRRAVDFAILELWERELKRGRRT